MLTEHGVIVHNQHPVSDRIHCDYWAREWSQWLIVAPRRSVCDQMTFSKAVNTKHSQARREAMGILDLTRSSRNTPAAVGEWDITHWWSSCKSVIHDGISRTPVGMHIAESDQSHWLSSTLKPQTQTDCTDRNVSLQWGMSGRWLRDVSVLAQ